MPSAPPTSAPTRGELRTVLTALVVGLVLSAMDAMIVATALPTIAGELGGLDHLPWVITAYLLTSTAAVPIFGKLSDIHGRRPLYQLAVVVFLAGSVASGAAQDMTQLIAARGLQGIGGGGLQALTFVILADVVAPRERARYMGSFTAIFAVMSVVGPLLGGVFTDTLTWRWAFYINIPFGIVTLAAASRLRAPAPGPKAPIDLLGTALLLPAVTCIVLVSVWGGQEYSWGSVAIVQLVAASLVLSALFVWREVRAADPLIPLRLFRLPALALPTIISIVLGAAMMGGMSFLPLYLQVAGGATATASGLLMVPMVGGFVTSTNITGRLISRYGRYKGFIVGGTASAAAGFGSLSMLSPDSATLHVTIGMFVFGAGVGASMPVLAVCVQNSAPHSQVGAATSTLNFFRSLGSAFGVAILGTVLSSQVLARLGDGIDRGILNSPAEIRRLPPAVRDAAASAVTSGITRVFAISAVLAAIAFVLSLRLREEPLRDTVAPLAATEGMEGAELFVDHDEPAPAVEGTPQVAMADRGSERRAGLETA